MGPASKVTVGVSTDGHIEDSASDSASDPAGAAILGAAVRILADGGLSAFTTDRLAAEARVSKTSIYRRWPDKKAIFRAVLSYWVRRAEVEDVGHLGRELEAWYADRQGEYNTPGWRAITTSVSELATHDPDIGEAMAVDRRATWNTLRHILQRAIGRGDISGEFDIDHLEQFLIGPIHYLGVLDDQPIDDEAIKTFRLLAIRALGYQDPGGHTLSEEGSVS
ncbi:MAG: TetR/AcrR family transcriptional regulator [Acidimicrobiales bacterium]|nr:TetR/AcrR family transcriptional regulator [Acidimicrobiales bacterium]